MKIIHNKKVTGAQKGDAPQLYELELSYDEESSLYWIGYRPLFPAVGGNGHGGTSIDLEGVVNAFYGATALSQDKEEQLVFATYQNEFREFCLECLEKINAE